MPSLFSSALAELDDNLQAIQTQNERLRGGLSVSENQLRRALAAAYRSATVLSDLISTQPPNANGIDREALDRLIRELNALRQRQLRRLKLLDLAMELNAGRVHHHRVNRTQSLNELRLAAVRELRVLASRSAQEKQIPGPSAGKWMKWACSLDEEEHATVLQSLSQGFPALEAFVSAIDIGNWAAGEHQAVELSYESAEEAFEDAEADCAPLTSAPSTDAAVAERDALARSLLGMFEKSLLAGEKKTISSAREHPASEAPSLSESPKVRPSDGSADEWPGYTTEKGTALRTPSRVERERLNKAAAADFLKVMKAWQLQGSQARQLLGVSRALFNQIQKGQNVILEPDKLARISILVAIWKGLNVLYGSRRGDKWVHRPNSNPLFNRQTPLKYMLKVGVEGLVSVRELVGVWSPYATTEEKQ